MIVTIRLRSDTMENPPIAGVVVSFYSTTGVFQTSGTTQSDGSVVVDLPQGSYDVTFFKTGVSILPKQPQRILVDPILTNEFQVSGHIRALPESPDPARCRVSGLVIGADGLPTKDLRLSFVPVQELVIPSRTAFVCPQAVVYVGSDEAGYFQFDLLRNVGYKAYIDGLTSFMGMDTSSGHTPFLGVQVPNLPGIDLQDLLYPLPVNLTFSVPSILLLLENGKNSSVTAPLLYSDGARRGLFPPWASLNLLSTNPAVAEVVRQLDGTVIINPLSRGVTVITGQRVIASSVMWPSPPAFLTSSLSVTVV